MGDSFLSIHLRKMFSASLSIIFIVFCLSIIPILSINSSSSSNNPVLKNKGFVVKLIHRDVIYPSKYPPISTHLDRTDLAINRVPRQSSPPNNVSIMSYSTSIMNQTSNSPESIGKINTTGFSFFAEIYIGTQHVRQYVALDTGSTILWVQCKGSKGVRTENPQYDPTLSRSYDPSTCRAPGDMYCKRVTGGRCDEQQRCEYFYEYEDGSHSKGFLGFETITFHKEGRSHTKSQVSNVLFGCGKDNRFPEGLHLDGILGIGTIMELSILERTKRKFSICFGKVSDKKYKYNHLALGDDAKLISNHPVQLNIQYRNRYDVILTSISIGKHKINMQSMSMKIDSGATFSYLREDIYLQIRRIVETEMEKRRKKRKKERIPNLPKGLCYQGPTLRTSFPRVSLELDPHNTINLDKDALFWEVLGENLFCLAFLPNTNAMENVIGLTALQYHNVGFDLNTNLVYFKKMDCKSLIN